MNIFMIRHGQTDWNIEKRCQGQADIELNENGRNQAYEVANELKDKNIDIIFSSPLKRAKKTAEIIGEIIKCLIIEKKGFSERNFGEFEGMRKDEFEYKKFWSYKENSRYERAENVRDFFERVYNELDNVKKDYKGKNILIVFHGGVSIPAKCYFEGMPDEYNFTGMALGNCEVAKYVVD